LPFDVSFSFFGFQYDYHVHHAIIDKIQVYYNIVAVAGILLHNETNPPITTTYQTIFEKYKNLFNLSDYHTKDDLISDEAIWFDVVNSFLPSDNQMQTFSANNSIMMDAISTRRQISVQNSGNSGVSRLKYNTGHEFQIGDFYCHPQPNADDSHTVTEENIEQERTTSMERIREEVRNRLPMDTDED